MVVQVERRGDANRLHAALDGYSSRIQRFDGRWEVAVQLDSRAAATLEEMFVALGHWLAESDLSSCRVSLTTLPSMKRVLMAGAPVSPGLLADVQKILPNGTACSPYGATESLPVASISIQRTPN